MKKTYLWNLLACLAICLLMVTGCSSDTSDLNAGPDPTTTFNSSQETVDESSGAIENEADISTDSDAAWAVAEITTLKEYGKSVDWLHSKNLIATARPLTDGYYDVLIFNMDNPEDEFYLTHNAAGAPRKHNGNPSWHPSGEYIAFTSENEDVEGELADFLAIPGKGVNCNVWLARADGTGFWQLTHYATEYDDKAKGVLHPQFSPDGLELFWAERAGGAAGTMWGEWELKVARFIDGNNPYLEDIRTFTPGAQNAFYESHAFSHDGQSILFTGNLERRQKETGMDIYEMNLASGGLTQLTSTFSDWDEHAHWSPDGTKIAWMSSTPLDIQYPPDMQSHEWPQYLATELWLMDADGSSKQRLTFFNEDGHAHQRAERTIVSDSTWAPDGKSLLVLLANYEAGGNLRTQLVIVTLEKSE